MMSEEDDKISLQPSASIEMSSVVTRRFSNTARRLSMDTVQKLATTDPIRRLSKDLERRISLGTNRRLSKDIERRQSYESIGRRKLIKDVGYHEEVVTTTMGPVTVAWKGNKTNPALVTYHDLGLNHVSNFQAFFNYEGMAEMVPHFCIFHINAPGQQYGAEILPDAYGYPNMDDLAEQVNDVLNQFKIVKYVGLGVGLGGNVLIRHALHYPERVDSLMLINTISTAPGWFEWGYQKRNIKHMRQHGITQDVLDFLIWHHFGPNIDDRPKDLVETYKSYFTCDVQASNLAKLTEVYNWRTEVEMRRENNVFQRGDFHTLKVPVLNMVGTHSAHVDETVVLNGKLNPETSEWMNVMDAAMVLEEQPEKVSEAFRIFLQGRGYCLRIRKQSIAEY